MDQPLSQTVQSHQKRNAFAELMSPKAKQTKVAEQPQTTPANPFATSGLAGRSGLGAYLSDPASFPTSRVVYYTVDFVIIKDLFPKSSLHLLILPRDARKTLLHPFDALADPPFLASVKAEADKVISLAAKELQRLHGKFSALDRAREEAMDADPVPDELPPGRDWQKEIMVGVHAVPSMTHLHIHVISKDRNSDCLKHRKHYNSFATPFFVPLDDMPLAVDDVRRHPGREGYLKADFECWRCGRAFGNKFVKLKDHLSKEFERWKAI